jgi:predicted ribonuclease toxin of YeeF-YezG toxin-antitoxin module
LSGRVDALDGDLGGMSDDIEALKKLDKESSQTLADIQTKMEETENDAKNLKSRLEGDDSVMKLIS